MIEGPRSFHLVATDLEAGSNIGQLVFRKGVPVDLRSVSSTDGGVRGRFRVLCPLCTNGMYVRSHVMETAILF